MQIWKMSCQKVPKVLQSFFFFSPKGVKTTHTGLEVCTHFVSPSCFGDCCHCTEECVCRDLPPFPAAASGGSEQPCTGSICGVQAWSGTGNADSSPFLFLQDWKNEAISGLGSLSINNQFAKFPHHMCHCCLPPAFRKAELSPAPSVFFVL